MEPKCPFCNEEATYEESPRHSVQYSCSRCGKYEITEGLLPSLNHNRFDKSEIAKISGWIRENQEQSITTYKLKEILELPTPSVDEKANKLLLYLSKRYPTAGQPIPYDINRANPKKEHLYLLSITWAKDFHELFYLFNTYFQQTKRFLIRDAENELVISPEGWAYIGSLRQINPDSQIAFVAMWLDKEVDPLWTKAIKPGIEASGYKPLRIDKHEHINRIDDEIIAMIRQSKFLVGDFTDQRRGVYFEAGFALGMGLPVIWVCPKDELKKVHFDTRQYNFLIWEDGKWGELRKALQYRIESIIGRGKYKTANTKVV